MDYIEFLKKEQATWEVKMDKDRKKKDINNYNFSKGVAYGIGLALNSILEANNDCK